LTGYFLWPVIVILSFLAVWMTGTAVVHRKINEITRVDHLGILSSRISHATPSCMARMVDSSPYTDISDIPGNECRPQYLLIGMSCLDVHILTSLVSERGSSNADTHFFTLVFVLTNGPLQVLCLLGLNRIFLYVSINFMVSQPTILCVNS